MYTGISKFSSFFFEGICTFLTGVLGDCNASHIQTFLPAKCFDQSQHIQIIGDTEISTNFVFFRYLRHL